MDLACDAPRSDMYQPGSDDRARQQSQANTHSFSVANDSFLTFRLVAFGWGMMAQRLVAVEEQLRSTELELERERAPPGTSGDRDGEDGAYRTRARAQLHRSVLRGDVCLWIGRN